MTLRAFKAIMKHADHHDSIVDAIKMVRGVVSVRAHVSDITQHVAIETARSELRRKLHEVLR